MEPRDANVREASLLPLVVNPTEPDELLKLEELMLKPALPTRLGLPRARDGTACWLKAKDPSWISFCDDILASC